MSVQLLLSAREAARFDDNLLGGKAHQLAWLSRHGFPVPEWVAFTTEAFAEQLNHGGLAEFVITEIARLQAQPEAVAEIAGAIRNRIEATDLAPRLRELLAAQLATLDPAGQEYFAVRSSVVGEDAEGASFAGQMDSHLFQRGLDQIAQSVVRVFASAFTERALIYRLNRGLPLTDIRAAVIIQRMIEGEVSGVLFTAHPVTGSRRHALVSACYGVGEGIVSGVCNTDEFTVPLDDGAIDVRINDKDVQVVFDRASGHGTEEVEVAESLREEACLSEAQARELVALGRKIALERHAPQDIEWAYRDGRFYLLQTRPVTSLPAPAQAQGEAVVWDNSNIQESYCGVTTPLTFTFANRAYATVYEQTLRVLGRPASAIESHRQMLNNLLGLIRGRVYYNINNWYRGLLLLPAFKTNKSDMERMMGLQDPVDLVEDRQLSFWDKLGMLKALFMLLRGFRKMDRLVAEFRAMFETEYQRIPRARLHELEMAELMSLAKQLDAGLLKRWSSPIINDFYVMMQNGKVHRWLESSGIENPSLLQNNLLSGEEGIESTEPTKFLLRMCDYLRAKPELRALVEQGDNNRLLDVLLIADSEFHRQCLEYIERYGDRTMGELKLESITLRQDPAFMFAVLKNFLSREDLTLATLATNEQRFRGDAEREAEAAVVAKHGRGGYRKFLRDLGRCRDAIRNRENMRLARTRMFGLYRDIYLEIGRQLAFYGVLANARDIFYLTVEELDAYMDGRSVQADWTALVATRQAEFAEYEKADLPHHFVTHGPIYHHNSYEYKGDLLDVPLDSTSLSGIGCYPGIVEEKIKLIFSPEDELSMDGQILCTVRTDPGWAPLFPTAGGILVERGSTLSHSAVVARELGIPAIVGVPGITRILRHGERVRMDGAKGTVERLDPIDNETASTSAAETAA